ncbi:hypothetical protein KIW84_074654 [Lathyrus oleraceus]|uniref:Uncharacterized protein n=1 Tax=Pisum sativum TaxID=3888 RepID=A0A9D4VUS3_PEA|nr:hypothetical protein KIW84_074654 [Pisum sativum]
MVLDDKGKLGFLIGAVDEPTTGDPCYKQWKSENSLIIAWVVSFMEIGIEDNVLFLKRQENDCVFMFFVGIDKDLDEVRGRVLGKVPLPTLSETFAEIRREEARQRIMIGKSPQNSESEGSALDTRNLDQGRRSNKFPWCDHCKLEWNTRETCWKLKGKPPNWKKKSGRAFQASNSYQGQQPPLSQFPLTTEQLDRMYKLLEYPTPSCSIETKGNSAFLSVSPSHTWIIDSGASDQMKGESTLFSSYSPCEGNQKIKIADGFFQPLQDLNSGKMIGSAKESGGLYYLDIGSSLTTFKNNKFLL